MKIRMENSSVALRVSSSSCCHHPVIHEAPNYGTSPVYEGDGAHSITFNGIGFTEWSPSDADSLSRELFEKWCERNDLAFDSGPVGLHVRRNRNGTATAVMGNRHLSVGSVTAAIEALDEFVEMNRSQNMVITRR